MSGIWRDSRCRHLRGKPDSCVGWTVMVKYWQILYHRRAEEYAMRNVSHLKDMCNKGIGTIASPCEAGMHCEVYHVCL